MVRAGRLLKAERDQTCSPSPSAASLETQRSQEHDIPIPVSSLIWALQFFLAGACGVGHKALFTLVSGSVQAFTGGFFRCYAKHLTVASEEAVGAGPQTTCCNFTSGRLKNPRASLKERSETELNSCRPLGVAGRHSGFHPCFELCRPAAPPPLSTQREFI